MIPSELDKLLQQTDALEKQEQTGDGVFPTSAQYGLIRRNPRRMLDEEMLDNIFTYHVPQGDQGKRYQEIREKGRGVVEAAQAFEEALIVLEQEIMRSVSDSEEKAQAQFLINQIHRLDQEAILKVIRQAIMWANAGIACNE